MTDHNIVEMVPDMYRELTALWRSTEGLWSSEDDEPENFQRLLKRNPGLSLVALREGMIIGAIECSHDGRRGYLHHLAVRNEYRNRGLGRELVQRCIESLHNQGIMKIRVFVQDSNTTGVEFWKNIGFCQQEYDYRTFSLDE
jgi:N-acetylglutamate synthase